MQSAVLKYSCLGYELKEIQLAKAKHGFYRTKSPIVEKIAKIVGCRKLHSSIIIYIIRKMKVFQSIFPELTLPAGVSEYVTAYKTLLQSLKEHSIPKGDDLTQDESTACK